MQNNYKIVIRITFLDHTDLDVMMDFKYKLGNELHRCLNDRLMATYHNEDLLQIVYNWADLAISKLIKDSRIPELKLDSSKGKKKLIFPQH